MSTMFDRLTNLTLPHWLYRVRSSPNTVLAVVSLALFVDLLAYSIVIPALPGYMEEHFGSDSTIVSILFGSYSISLVVFTPIFGILSDKPSIGRRPPMLLGLLGLVGSSIFFGIGSELWMLFLARVLQGVSAASTWSVGLAMVADVFPADVLGAKMGIVMSINGIGLLLGPTIGGVMYDTIGWLSMFILTAAIVGLDLIARVFLIDEDYLQDSIARTHAKNLAVLKEDRARQRRANDTTTPATHTVDVNDSVMPTSGERVTADKVDTLPPQPELLERQTSAPVQTNLTIWTMLLNHHLMTAIMGCLIAAISLAALEPILPLWLAAVYGYSTTIVGLIFLAMIGGYSLMSVAAGYLADRYRKLTIMAIGLALLAVSFPLLGLTTQTWQLILAEIFVGIAIAVSITPCLPLISEHLQHVGQIQSQGQGYALFNLAYAGGSAIGSLVSGAMYQHLGFLNAMVIFGSISAALSVFLFAYCYWMPDHIALAQAERRADRKLQEANAEMTEQADKLDAAGDEKIVPADIKLDSQNTPKQSYNNVHEVIV